MITSDIKEITDIICISVKEIKTNRELIQELMDKVSILEYKLRNLDGKRER